MAHDVFISYSTKDKIIADALCAKLEENGIRTWIAPRDVTPGSNFAESIVNAINDSEVFVLIWSGNANASKHILNEINMAFDQGISIIPFRIQDVQPSSAMSYYLGNTHWLDAYDPSWESHIKKLINTVSSQLETTIPDEDVEIPETLIPKQKTSQNKGIRPIVLGIVSGALVISLGWYGFTQFKKTDAETRVLNLPLTEQEGVGDIENGPCSEVLPDLDLRMHLELCDTFDTNVNEWRVDKSAAGDVSENFEISNGVYVWHFECNNNDYGCIGASYSNRASRLSDFYLVVDIRRIDGPINMEYGIQFRNDGRNYYEFRVNDSQKYSVSSYSGGEFEFLIYEQTASMLKPNEVNRLAVQAIGTRFVFYINNEIVGELENDNLPEGISGVLASFYKSGEGTLQIDNFGVYVP